MGTMMNAIVRTRYGLADGLQLREVERPEPSDDSVVVRVRACSVNQVDCYEATGTPWIARPMTGLRSPRSGMAGHDFSGTVESVGKGVTDVRPGDDVFGMSAGSFAEYVSVEGAVGRMPASVTFQEAAAVPLAGLTALQALRDHGQVRPGQKVLVNGASGGVGTFAVQIARAFDTEVTAVCSTRHVEQAESLGADRVIDYTRSDFTQSGERYDVILDVSGDRSWSQYRRVMDPHATLVMIGSAATNRLLGPLGHIARLRLAGWRGDQTAVFFVAKGNRADLDALRDLVESGKVTPVVEEHYELSEVGDALRQLSQGHAHGKIVITV
jgi:NADPH:quinone reductase-like Zn-dependent oxidoreductase